MKNALSLASALPVDAADALLVGRVWVEGTGPVLALVTPESVFDLSSVAATSSQLLELPGAAKAVRAAAPSLPRLAGTTEVLANSAADARKPALPWLLAPCDLQALKAAGVTFVASMRNTGRLMGAQAERSAALGGVGAGLASSGIQRVSCAGRSWSRYIAGAPSGCFSNSHSFW